MYFLNYDYESLEKLKVYYCNIVLSYDDVLKWHISSLSNLIEKMYITTELYLY